MVGKWPVIHPFQDPQDLFEKMWKSTTKNALIIIENNSYNFSITYHVEKHYSSTPIRYY